MGASSPLYSVKLYGPPGTGKTFQSVRWIVEQVKRGADPYGIAFVSFTNVACDEARERICSGLRASGIEIEAWELPYCATIHKLCKTALGIEGKNWNADAALREFAEKYGYAFGFPRGSAEGDMDQIATGGHDAPLRAVWDWGRARLITDPDAAYTTYCAYDPEGAYRVAYDRFMQFVQDYESWKTMAFRLDFTDLLLRLIESERHLPASIVAIDEAQDMSPALWRAADTLFAECPLRMIAADDDQAIYSYQGADPRLFNERSAARVVKLEQSVRLPRRVAELAASVIDANTNRVPKRVLANPAKGDGEVQRVRSIRDLDLLNGEPWMILVRNWCFVGELAAELEADGIPYLIQGDAQYSPWSDKGPLRAVKTLYALSTPGGSVSAHELAGFADKTRTQTKDKPGAWLRGAKTRIDELAKEDMAQRFALMDLPELGLTEHGLKCIALRDLDLLTGLSARDLATYKSAQARGTFELTPSVLLSTIHGVKGGEAPNVAVLMSCTAAPARSLEDPARCEEERRLAYVAITRASRAFYAIDGSSVPFGQPYEIFGV